MIDESVPGIGDFHSQYISYQNNDYYAYWCTSTWNVIWLHRNEMFHL